MKEVFVLQPVAVLLEIERAAAVVLVVEQVVAVLVVEQAAAPVVGFPQGPVI